LRLARNDPNVGLAAATTPPFPFLQYMTVDF
jgi:hypothetical protein